ncbi:MAG: TolC family protein [Bacteroidota bacterium]|nr:TolC family protein [Bacteroidota bacterium]MDP4233612.1 TolC family protein [Bacteroidota bacterium]MDP4243128.1 TolC family protein [Bacteroidota bacterium]MDP4288540.1 TolC family protein [Bacteroidota bacterium]
MKSFLLSLAFLLSSTVQSIELYAQQTDTLTLAEAVQMAVRTAPSARAAEAAVDAAKAHVKEIDSYAYPQLNGDANYTRIDPVVSIDFPVNGHTQTFNTMPNNNYNGNLNVQQLITAFGREGANERVAISGIQTATDNLQQSQTMAAYQTVQAYYAVLTTDQAIHVEQDQLTVLQDNLKITLEREKQGTATSLDPLSVRVRISTIQSQIADLTSTRRKQAAQLRRLIGLSPNAPVLVTRPAQGQPLPEQIDSLHAIAERQRTEIQLAKDAERTARLQIDAARMANNPVLSANVSGGVKDGYLPNLTDPKLNWAGTVALHVPILDGGRVSSQVDQADANYRAAQARLEDAERGIESDIEQALADIDASRSRLELVTTQIEQAQQAFSVAQVRYANGVATNLDVLTAQQALEQTRLQQAQLMYSYELSEYNLNRAVGTKVW